MTNRDKKKRVMVDMSATLLHYGHIRLLEKASKYGKVIVALTSDKDIKKFKKISPEMNYTERSEIIKSIKYVNKVVLSDFIITDKFLRKHKIDLLIHGNDNKNKVNKKKILIFKRTKNISSSSIRKKVFNNVK